MIKSLINKFHSSRLFGGMFHTLNHCLRAELKECKSVLDLGCGPSSPIQFCKHIEYSVGVEAFDPYLEASKKKRIHTEYLRKKIEEVDFPENSFDAVIMIEVLEHLPENVGFDVLKKAERWAKKKVIISSPNGFISQKEVDNNPLQKHLSGWNYAKMRNLGYKSYGLAGVKFLRQEAQNDSMNDDLLSSIRFEPKLLWFFVATLSQIITYFVPKLSFELLSVKKLNKKI